MKTDIFHHIIDFMSQNCAVTKSDIAKALGISAATVVNYLDYLKSCKLIRSSYSAIKSSQRHSVRYYVSTDKFFIVYTIRDDVFEAYYLSLSLKIKHKFSYKINSGISFEQNLYYISKYFDYNMLKFKSRHCVGVCALIPRDINDKYADSEMEKIRNIAPSNENYTCAEPHRIVAEYISKKQSDESVLVLQFDKGSYVSSCTAVPTDYDNIRLTDFGANYKVNGISIVEYINSLTEPSEMIDTLAEFINNISSSIAVNSVYIGGDLFMNMGALVELIENKLSASDLRFETIDKHVSVIEAARKSRTSYINAVVSSYLCK